MIVYKTELDKIPQNCKECKFIGCNLPMKQNTYRDEIKKEYEKKRHKNCPLMEIEQ